MGTTYSLIREPASAMPIDTTTSHSDSPGSASLAELLAEVGMTIDALTTNRITQVSPQIAAVTANLVDGAHEAGADGGLFTPSRETVTTLSLRALGRLATRTAGSEIRLAPARAQRVRDLVAEIAA
jgi:hypothetical protein